VCYEGRWSLTFLHLAEGFVGLGGLILCRQEKKRIVGLMFVSVKSIDISFTVLLFQITTS
jgi:hypothetical protein